MRGAHEQNGKNIHKCRYWVWNGTLKTDFSSKKDSRGRLCVYKGVPGGPEKSDFLKMIFKNIIQI